VEVDDGGPMVNKNEVERLRNGIHVYDTKCHKTEMKLGVGGKAIRYWIGFSSARPPAAGSDQ
jgi:hypothetical protein